MNFYNSLVLVDILVDEYAKIIIDFVLISLDLVYMYCCNNIF